MTIKKERERQKIVNVKFGSIIVMTEYARRVPVCTGAIYIHKKCNKIKLTEVYTTKRRTHTEVQSLSLWRVFFFACVSFNHRWDA